MKILRPALILALFVLLGDVAAQILPEAERRGPFLVIPNGWMYFLAAFVIVTSGIALIAYLYGRVTRPGKAVQYAVTSATHMFILIAIALVMYPVIYLLAVSLNRNNTLARALPREGNILVRSGVMPDPADFSFVQYQTVLGETNLLWYQFVLIAIIALALITLVVLAVMSRTGSNPYVLDRWRAISGWTIFLSAAALVISINPAQFYSISEETGRRVPSSSEGKMVLYIRNTLLVSGMTGLFAVLISTTAGYAFARMKFEGRYQTLMIFIFIQMFPGFMALVAIFYLMNYLGLLNTFTGLILAYSGGAIAFSSWIFKGYLESISPSLEEAAMVDGATRWGAFWRIILPVSIPMLLFIFLLQFIGTYSEFILANILLTGNDNWTVGLGLRNFAGQRFNTQWGTLAASAVLGSLPILAIFYSFQSALTGQHQAGGVKG